MQRKIFLNLASDDIGKNCLGQAERIFEYFKNNF